MRRSVLVGIAAVLGAILCLGRLATGHAEETMSFQILQPLPDQQIHGDKLALVIAFQSTENAPVVRFDAYLDSSTWLVGGRIKNPIPAGSFRVEADLADLKVKPGKHMLYVKLFDSQGRMVQQERAVTVEPLTLRQVEKNPPKVRITSPKAGDTITDKTKITVDASDDTGVKYVIIYVNKQIRAWMNEAPYMIPWDPIGEKMKSGNVTLSAQAVDLFENAASSDEVIVKIANNLIPEGNTWIEKVGSTNPVPDETRFTFPPTTTALPNFGASTPRIVFTNEVKPLSATLADATGVLLPNLATLTRNYPLSGAGGEMLALLAPKRLPGSTDTATLQALSARGITVAPALAALGGGATRPGLWPGARTPLAPAALAAPTVTTSVAARTLPSSDAPLLMAFMPTLGKDTPARVSTMPASDMLPADSVAVFIATPEAGSALQRLALVGAVRPDGVRGDAATLTVNPLTGARTMSPDAPTLVALVPALTKQTPGAVARTEMSPETVTATHITLTPGAGGSSSRTQVDSPAYSSPAHGLAQASKVSLDGGAPRGELYALVPAPAGSALAGKGQPGHTALPVQADPVSVAGTQAGLAPGASSGTARPETGYTVTRVIGDPATPAVTGGTPSRTVSSDAPAVGAPTLPKATPTLLARADTTDTPELTRSSLPTPNPGGSNPTPAYATPKSPATPDAVPMIEIERRYTVKSSETVQMIAKKYNITPEEFIKHNPGMSPDRPLPAGTVVRVPRDQARLYVDDTPITTGPTPFVTNGYTMVPIRFIVEAKGGVVVWLPATREVNAWANNTFMHVQVGSREARINGTSLTLPVPVATRNARTMVPLRYMMTALNMQMEYNPASGTYSLISRAP
jgi:LysM repeat protein